MVGSVRVLLFASAREAVGRSELSWAVPAAGMRAGELLRAVAARFPALGRVLAHSRIARNGVYLRRLGARCVPGDELAVHPPYGGG